jgi:hypothetical protein
MEIKKTTSSTRRAVRNTLKAKKYILPLWITMNILSLGLLVTMIFKFITS